MIYTTLIAPVTLAAHLNDLNWVIVDARFSLAEPELGRQNYQSAHIPGAVYAHLNEDLSAPVVPGVTGRHPLPDPQTAGLVFERMGVGPGVQVVVYDDQGGALAAVRVWWMLRWLGHEAVAVLDGGWQAWQRGAFTVFPGTQRRPSRTFTPQVRPEMLVDAAQVDAMRREAGCLVLDARAAERYYGQNETIDPVAGHIPGALSAPYAGNLNPDGSFRSQQELRARYESLLGGLSPENVAVYCGSGVTSIHNILAMQHAGLGGARLYAGSWSEWIAGGSRPVAIGPQPG